MDETHAPNHHRTFSCIHRLEEDKTCDRLPFDDDGYCLVHSKQPEAKLVLAQLKTIIRRCDGTCRIKSMCNAQTATCGEHLCGVELDAAVCMIRDMMDVVGKVQSPMQFAVLQQVMDCVCLRTLAWRSMAAVRFAGMATEDEKGNLKANPLLRVAKDLSASAARQWNALVKSAGAAHIQQGEPGHWLTITDFIKEVFSNGVVEKAVQEAMVDSDDLAE